MRASRFVLRYSYILTPIDSIGRHGPANITANISRSSQPPQVVLPLTSCMSIREPRIDGDSRGPFAIR